MGRCLTGQRLAHPRQRGEQELEDRARHELGHPPAAGRLSVERACVEALHQSDVTGRQQWPEQPGDEGRCRVGHVGVEEDHHVAGRCSQRGGHGAALAPRTARPVGAARALHHEGARVAGLGRRVVERPVVEHDHLVDEPVASLVGQEGLNHRPDHRSHGRGLVVRRDAHRDAPTRARLGFEKQLSGEVPVVIGVAHAHDSSSRAAGRVRRGVRRAALRWSRA